MDLGTGFGDRSAVNVAGPNNRNAEIIAMIGQRGGDAGATMVLDAPTLRRLHEEHRERARRPQGLASFALGKVDPAELRQPSRQQDGTRRADG